MNGEREREREREREIAFFRPTSERTTVVKG